MAFRIRAPSPTRRIAARTSLRRYVRQSLGVKVPRGMGWLTHPRRAHYNRIYARTTISPGALIGGFVWLVMALVEALVLLAELAARALSASSKMPSAIRFETSKRSRSGEERAPRKRRSRVRRRGGRRRRQRA